MKKRNILNKMLSVILIMGLLAAMMSGCGTKSEDKGSQKTEGKPEDKREAGTKKVRFGLLPYQDWMPWMLADELGYFEEAGIELEIITFTDDITCAEALQSGDIDIACGNSGSGPLAFSKFPELRIIGCTCGFLGYAIMVRPEDVKENGGDIKTYEDFYAEEIAKGTDEDKAMENAVKNACKQLEGKTIVMDRGTGSNLPLNAALKAADLTKDDLKFMDITDVEGALAFLDGTGDFELGGYPQVTSLSENNCYKLVSGAELGGEAVCLSVEMARADYIAENMDTIVAMREVWYKIIDDIYSDDTSYMEKLAEVTGKYTGTDVSLEDMKNIAENIDPWPLKEEAAQLFFEDGGKWNIEEIYGGSLDYWTNINGQVEAGTVDLQVQADTVKDIHSKITK
ncbi:MAG: ABC transporter substrate-binding protein [Dorea sp.]|nr:ABC transporter substrate-binding protein [Dorea sp.]